MKQQFRKLLGLPSLALVAFIGFAGAAQAYTCANVPSSVSGDVDITESGSCTISHALTASGHIHITAGSSITAQDLSAQSEVDLNASTDITITGAVNANFSYVRMQGNNVGVTGTVSTTTFGNILLLAQANLKTGSITSAPGYNIDLKANLAGANTLFTIGGTGLTNGVNGTVTAQPLGNEPGFASTVLYITNGTAASTGGIKLSSASALVVTPPAGSRAGYIYLNAQSGVLSMPTGTLSANGGTSDGAGLIGLAAKTISFAANAGVSANQSSGVAGTLHGVFLAAQTITYSGTGGLTISANGDGADTFNIGYVQSFPKGSITISDTLDPLNLVINGTIVNATGNITYQGSGTAPLTQTANGSHSLVNFSGSVISFTGGKVTLQAQGATDHKIQFQKQASDGSNSLNFGGTGAVSLNVDGVAGTGGDIKLFLDQAAWNAPSFTLSANGPTASSGNGGTVTVSAGLLTLSPTSKVTITANASSFGTGDAIFGDPNDPNAPKAIVFYPGNTTIDIGTASGVGQYSFAAKGGKSGGRGGSVYISAGGVNLKTATAINASALAGNSDGGEIFINNVIQAVDPAATVSAIGKGTGMGGKFNAFHNPSASSTFDVNKIIKVDGGASITTSTFDGSITLNTIPCQQFKTGYANFPKSYWNCVNTTPGAAEKEPALFIHNQLPNIQSILNGKTQLYVFSDLQSFEFFFSEAAPTDFNAVTFRSGNGGTGTIYSSLFENDSAGNPYTLTILDSHTAHEIGHAVDDVLGGTTEQSANGTTYDLAWAKRDFFYLDFLDLAGTQPRDPCVTSGSTTAPFAGLAFICTSNGLAQAYVGLSNSKIIQRPEVAQYINSRGSDLAWSELYANTFALPAFDLSLPLASRSYPTSDAIVANGYFSCTLAWVISANQKTY